MIWIVNRKKLAFAASGAIVTALAVFALFFSGSPAVSTWAAARELPVYRVDTGTDKVIAVTFDAAWGDEKTQDILDILSARDGKATFFLVGFWADAYPQQVKAIDEAGCEIGNHSSTHPHMSELDSEAIAREIVETNEKITALTGQVPTLFRPPYGDYDNEVISTVRDLGMEAVQWDVDSLDWKNLGAQPMIDRVLEKTSPGSIILFHNNSDYILEALPVILDALAGEGYRFVTVSDLLIDGPSEILHDGTQRALPPAPESAG